MNIGFDLDGVLIDKPPLIPKSLIDWLYRGHDHRLYYRFPSKPEQWIRSISHVSILRPSIGKNIESIKQMRSLKANRYYLVSSRFAFLKKRTEVIIERYHLERMFDGMFFNFEDQQPHVFKNELVKRLKLDRYVDDDLPLLRFLTKENPKTKFYWLNKNRRERLEENLSAITNLPDVLT